ncbi:hypothetical protein [Microbulbifer sp. SAOS-129_SWC]|uniref:hypothetical protein n=1 Tax=Microbulbifer sp. SAOS-129_SWC TaxID=3145235 RepID=UPI0032169413
MKKYRTLIHSATVFISTLYILMLAGFGGQQNPFKAMVVREIAALLPANGTAIEYEIYIAAVPLLILWILVLRLTHMSREEKDIEYYKRDKRRRKLSNMQR